MATTNLATIYEPNCLCFGDPNRTFQNSSRVQNQEDLYWKCKTLAKASSHIVSVAGPQIATFPLQTQLEPLLSRSSALCTICKRIQEKPRSFVPLAISLPVIDQTVDAKVVLYLSPGTFPYPSCATYVYTGTTQYPSVPKNLDSKYALWSSLGAQFQLCLALVQE